MVNTLITSQIIRRVLIGAANKSEVGYCKGYTLFALYDLYLTLYISTHSQSLYFDVNNQLYLESYGHFELPCLIQSHKSQYALYLTFIEIKDTSLILLSK